jgi:hypothetical protein
MVRYTFYSNASKWDYRLQFTDSSGEIFQLAVVDLAFRRKLDGLRSEGLNPNGAAARVLAELRKHQVYLRIGLARGWSQHPDRCYLQITGVYAFPR